MKQAIYAALEDTPRPSIRKCAARFRTAKSTSSDVGFSAYREVKLHLKIGRRLAI